MNMKPRSMRLAVILLATLALGVSTAWAGGHHPGHYPGHQKSGDQRQFQPRKESADLPGCQSDNKKNGHKGNCCQRLIHHYSFLWWWIVVFKRDYNKILHQAKDRKNDNF